MDWKPEHTIALTPIGLAVVVSLLMAILNFDGDTITWVTIIVFFCAVPFAVGRLIDRAR